MCRMVEFTRGRSMESNNSNRIGGDSIKHSIWMTGWVADRTKWQIETAKQLFPCICGKCCFCPPDCTSKLDLNGGRTFHLLFFAFGSVFSQLLQHFFPSEQQKWILECFHGKFFFHVVSPRLCAARECLINMIIQYTNANGGRKKCYFFAHRSKITVLVRAFAHIHV